MSHTPDITVLVGFETTTGFATPFQLDNAIYGKLDTGTLGGVQMVNLTSMVESITITRGRNREMEQFNAGTASLRFRDPTRILDPLNTAAPYYPYVAPRNPVEIYADGVEIFCGVVGDWKLDYGISAQDNYVTAACSDPFTVLANQNMNEWTPTAQSSGARVAAVLALPEVVYQGPRSIDTGSSTLGAYLVQAGTNVLQYLQLVSASEQGYFFVSGDGTLTFRGRSSALNATPTIQFTDDGTGVKYQTLTNNYGDQLLYNYIQTQSPAGAVQITSKTSSIAQYQAQQLSKLDLLNSTTTEVAALGNYLLGKYADPVLRFTGVQIELAALSSSQQLDVLNTDITDVVSVKKSFPSGSPASVTQTLITTGVAHQITPASHVVRFTFESTDNNAYLTLDNAIFGTLDNNLLAF